jgi:hypothetical protein
MVEAGNAIALLGNHELNLLRGERKHGNDWFWNEGALRDSVFRPWQVAAEVDRQAFLEFFASLPLTFERTDLRVTHAAWHALSVQRLAGLDESTTRLFDHFEEDVHAALSEGEFEVQLKDEQAQWRHHFADPRVDMPMLHAVGKRDEIRQMGNPIRVLTSGIERPAGKPFFSSGQWRFAERVRWWDDYVQDVPVIVGHYWRRFISMDRATVGKGDPDLFVEVRSTDWLGPSGTVFCVDYSVGGRYAERASGNAGANTRLAAMRWPERQLVFDNGDALPSTRFGGR